MPRKVARVRTTYKAVDSETGKVTTLTEAKAHELLIGGLVGFISLADQMKFPAHHVAALFEVMKEAVQRAPPESLAAVYDRLGGQPLPDTVRKAIMAKPKPNGHGVSRRR